MIPDPVNNLGLLANRILTEVLVDLKSEYVMSDTAMVGMLLAAMQGELGRGIEHRMTDIKSMKALFAQALDQVKDKVLKAELNLALDLDPASLAMVDVNSLHNQQTRTLIQLHEYVEQNQIEKLNADIWQYLDEQAARYVLDVPM